MIRIGNDDHLQRCQQRYGRFAPVLAVYGVGKIEYARIAAFQRTDGVKLLQFAIQVIAGGKDDNTVHLGCPEASAGAPGNIHGKMIQPIHRVIIFSALKGRHGRGHHQGAVITIAARRMRGVRSGDRFQRKKGKAQYERVHAPYKFPFMVAILLIRYHPFVFQ